MLMLQQRPRFRLALGGAAALVIIAGSASVDTTAARDSDSTCADHHVCFWIGYEYQGDKASRGNDAPTQEWIPIEGDNPVTRHSVKNRFNRRRVLYTGVDGPAIDPIRCIDPNDERPHIPNGAKYMWISDLDPQPCPGD